MRDLKVSRNGAGDPVVSGRLEKTDTTGPPAVGLLTYQLTGTITDSNGKPVEGAQVSTRTLDRDYWTVSTASDSTGHYDSLFTASAEVSGNPVPFTVRVSKGDSVYQFLSQEFVNFQRLKSARLDIRLLPTGYAFALPVPHVLSGSDLHRHGRRGHERSQRYPAGVGYLADRPEGKGQRPVHDHAPEEARRQVGLALGRQTEPLLRLPGEAGRSDRPAGLAGDSAGGRAARTRHRHAEVEAIRVASSVRSRTPAPLAPLPR